jgi:hypothetical protein
MRIGGRIPPLLELFALVFRRSVPWFDFFVMHGRKAPPRFALAFSTAGAMFVVG